VTAFVRKLLRTWAFTFAWIALLSGGVALLLAATPGGQLLAQLPAFYLSFPGAILIGAPHFSAEYAIPMTTVGFIITGTIWVLISGVVAVGLVGYSARRRAGGQAG